MYKPLPLSHVGIYCHRLDRVLPFYQRWFGMVVSDYGISSGGSEVLYLTANAEEHHQLMLINGRDASLPAFNQIAFRIGTLEELIAQARSMHEAGVEILEQKDHGGSWSLYVADPEGNRLEIFCRTPWYVSQPTWWSLDLLNDDAETIFANTQASARAVEGFMPRDEWVQVLTAKLHAAQVVQARESDA